MNELSRLPGIGMRSAERIAFHLLKQNPQEALKLARAIEDVKTRIRHCSVCYNLTEQDPCGICSDTGRDQSVVCVVEQPKDLLALEATGLYRGAYHVLLGRIAPLEDSEPGDLTIDPLMQLLASGTIREVIKGTNPTMERDGTALYIQSRRGPVSRHSAHAACARTSRRKQHRIRQQEHFGRCDQRKAEDVRRQPAER